MSVGHSSSIKCRQKLHLAGRKSSFSALLFPPKSSHCRPSVRQPTCSVHPVAAPISAQQQLTPAQAGTRLPRSWTAAGSCQERLQDLLAATTCLAVARPGGKPGASKDEEKAMRPAALPSASKALNKPSAVSGRSPVASARRKNFSRWATPSPWPPGERKRRRAAPPAL